MFKRPLIVILFLASTYFTGWPLAGSPGSAQSQPAGAWLRYGDFELRIAATRREANGALFPGGRVMVRLTGKPTSAVVLCEFQRWVAVLVSPDGKSLAVNDHDASDDATVRLFQHTGGVQFREKTKPSPVDAAWQFLRDTERVPFPRSPEWAGVLGHRYIEVVAFSSDSRKVLLKLWGHETVETRLDDWFCVYELETGKVSLDLSHMNAGAVHFKR